MPLGSILGGVIGAGGASAAGSAAGAAGVQAWQRAQEERARNQASITPWMNTGAEAINKLAQAYGLGHLDNAETDPTWGGRRLITSEQGTDRANALRDFQASPGYQFRVGEGIKALDRSAASRGMVQSGAQMRAINDYGQSQGSQEWGNYLSGLGGLAGAGMNAQMGTNQTNAGLINQGNSLNMQGDMGRASSYATSANALAQGIQGGINSLGSIVGFGLGNGWFGGLGGGAGATGGNPLSGFSTTGVRMGGL